MQFPSDVTLGGCQGRRAERRNTVGVRGGRTAVGLTACLQRGWPRFRRDWGDILEQDSIGCASSWPGAERVVATRPGARGTAQVAGDSPGLW